MILPLTKAEIKKIMELLLKKTYKMLAQQGLTLVVSDRAKDLLADLGYDPQFGARPMKRVLQKEIVNELSKVVLSGQFGEGDTIYVHVENKKIVFGDHPVEEQEAPEEEAPKAEEQGGGRRRRRRKKPSVEELEAATKAVEEAVKEVKEEKGEEPQEQSGLA